MDEFLVNQATAGNQSQPSAAGLRGTQCIAVWEDRGTDTIKGRLFGLNGVAASNEFVVNAPGEPGTKRQLPKVIETQQGVAVAWIEKPVGGQPLLQLRTLAEDTLSGPVTQVSTAPVEPLIWPAITRLADRGFAAAWADQRENERILVQRFGLEGTANGADFRANTAPGLHRIPMVAGLTDGNIAVGWRARILAPLHLRLQIFNASAPVGAEQITNIEITDAAMAPLDSGEFVIAHIRNAGDSEPGFETTVTNVSVFAANGAFVRRFAATSSPRILSPGRTSLRSPADAFSWRGRRQTSTTPRRTPTSARASVRARARSVSRYGSTPQPAANASACPPRRRPVRRAIRRSSSGTTRARPVPIRQGRP